MRGEAWHGAGSDAPATALATAIGGMLALAGAMGIGRFLLTPALPMMAEGGALGAAGAGLVAAANYAGYLAGALGAGLLFAGASPRALLIAALAGSALTSAAMAAAEAPAWWAAMRALGGIASAVVLVSASTLVLSRLKAAGRERLSSVHFAGVGLGIALSAVLSAPAFAASDGWRTLWIAGGGATGLLLLGAALLLPRRAAQPAAATSTAAAKARGLWRLVLAYGCLGFGYVVLATFLVSILREEGAGRWPETLLWLAVGLSAAPSVALWAWVGRQIGALAAFRIAIGLEAAGVAIAALSSGTVALTVAAVALGGTFMGLTALGLAEAARRAGGDGRRTMGLMTASFGTGQIIGPAIAGLIREGTGSYAAALGAAALCLALGALVIGPLIAADKRGR